MKIAEYIKALNIETRTEGDHHCRPGWIQLRCPFCSDGKSGSFHLGISLRYHSVNCYRCGGHGLSETLHRLSGESFKRIATILQEDIQKQTEDLGQRKTGTLQLPHGIEDMGPLHRDYLEGRGFDPNVISRQWGVRGIGIAIKYRWRLFIPIHHKHEMVSWTTRTIGDAALRYQAADPSMESINHRHLLYGEDHCEHSLIVHEGPIDVWRTGKGAVATFGTAFSRKQVLRIAKYRRRIICFDNEKHAQKQANKLYEQLAAFPGETINVRLDAKDAGEASDKEIRQLRRLLKGKY